MPGFWRQCRIAFRCVRFAVWAAVLLVLAAFAWFNVVGLPGFLKTRLVTALHQRGVEWNSPGCACASSTASSATGFASARRTKPTARC
jgi:hypothetical protein